MGALFSIITVGCGPKQNLKEKVKSTLGRKSGNSKSLNISNNPQKVKPINGNTVKYYFANNLTAVLSCIKYRKMNLVVVLQ